MFDRLTDRARRVIQLAEAAAADLDYEYVGTEHLLLGLVAEAENAAAIVLARLGVDDVDKLREQMVNTPRPAGQPDRRPAFSPRARKVIELAGREALQLGVGYIACEHFLLGMVREGQGVAMTILHDEYSLDAVELRAAVIHEIAALLHEVAGEAPGSRHMITIDFNSSSVQNALEWIQDFDRINGVGEDHPLATLLRYLRASV